MRAKKLAVVCGEGVGDLLLMMIACQEYKKAGYEVTIFSQHLASFGKWFEGFSSRPHIPIDDYRQVFPSFDVVLLQHENSPRAKSLCLLREERIIPHLIVFYHQYQESKHGPVNSTDFAFDYTKSAVENISFAVQKLMQLPSPPKENGLKIPSHLVHKKYPKRVIIHPTSSNTQKNWLPSKFVSLAKKLRSKGFQPVFTVSKKERPDWVFLQEMGIDVPLLLSLDELAQKIYESGFFIGNDSGPGHLASYLQIPLITISALHSGTYHWKPGWLEGQVVVPPPWTPNLKGLRLKQTNWQHFITVKKVLKTFDKLINQC